MLNRELVLFVIFFSPICILAEDDNSEVVERTRSAMQERAYAELHNEYSVELLESGLDSLDVKKILSDLSIQATDCLFAILERHARQHSTDLETLFSRTEDSLNELNPAYALISPEGSQYCFNLALENAGLPME